MKRVIRVLSSLMLCIMLALGMAPVKLEAAATSGLIEVKLDGMFNEGQTRQVLELVNQQRVNNGAKQLTMSAELEAAAKQRAAELVLLFSHKRPDGSDCIAVTGNLWYTTAGENIAANYSSAADVMNEWMNSEEHRRNILNPAFDHIGIGCFQYGGTNYWVQIFTGGNDSMTAAPAQGSDGVAASVTCKVDPSITGGYTIAFAQNEATLQLGASAAFDLKMMISGFSSDLSAADVKALGGQVSITGNPAVQIDPISGQIMAASKGTLDKAVITVVLNGQTVSKSITVICSHPEGSLVTEGNPATCTADGYERVACGQCGTVISEGTVPALGHDFGEWTVTREAAWEEEGEQTRTCSRCGEKETQVIPMLSQGHEHDFTGKETIIKEATCTEAGKKSVACAVPECGEVHEEEIPALGHDFGEWTVTREATWEREGEKTRTCSRCGEKETQVIPMLSQGHEHDFTGKETIIKEATCTEAGSKKIACSDPNCDAVTTVEIPATGHKAGEWKTIRTATCTNRGYAQLRCTVCNALLDEKGYPKTEHTYGDWKVTKQATTTKTGERQKVCKDCGYVYKETVPRLTAADTVKNTAKTTKAVQTGDTSGEIVWAVLLALAGAVIVMEAVTVRRKK